MLRLLPILAFVVAAGCTPDETPAPAASSTAQREADLVVENASVRPAPAGGVTAAFFRIANGTDAADTLVAARADVSADVQVHRTTEGPDGMRGMEQAASVPVAAGETVVFEPGGLHLMLISLDRDLAVGDTIAIDLDFAQLGTVSLLVPVRPPLP